MTVHSKADLRLLTSGSSFPWVFRYRVCCAFCPSHILFSNYTIVALRTGPRSKDITLDHGLLRCRSVLPSRVELTALEGYIGVSIEGSRCEYFGQDHLQARRDRLEFGLHPKRFIFASWSGIPDERLPVDPFTVLTGYSCKDTTRRVYLVPLE